MPGRAKRDRFECSMLPHLGRAYNLARYLMQNHHDAEDVIQDAYLKAYKAFDQQAGDDAAAWLLKIVRNTCLTLLKRNTGRGKVVRLDPNPNYPTDISSTGFTPDPQPLPDAALIERDTCNRVRAAVAKLPLDFREVIVLREFEDLSYQQIADITQVPIGTVMSRLSRARKHLRDLLIADEDGGRQNEL